MAGARGGTASGGLYSDAGEASGKVRPPLLGDAPVNAPPLAQKKSTAMQVCAFCVRARLCGPCARRVELLASAFSFRQLYIMRSFLLSLLLAAPIERYSGPAATGSTSATCSNAVDAQQRPRFGGRLTKQGGR